MEVCFIAFSMVVIDFITGMIKAFALKSFNSSIMREGLVNKALLVILMAVSVLLDYGQTVIDFGYSVPLTNATCIYIVIMELGSMIENIGKINDKCIPPSLQKFFEKLNGKE